MNSVANGKIRASTPFTRGLHSARGRRQRHGARRGAARVASTRCAARAAAPMTHAYWGTAPADAEVRAAIEASGASERAAIAGPKLPSDAGAVRRIAAPSRRRPGRRLVSGPHGMGRARARATAASWPIRAARTCARSSTPRSSSASASGRSRRRWLEEALDEYFVGAVPDPFMLQVYPVREDKRTRDPGRHARRRIRAAADRESRRPTRSTGG